MALLSRGKAGFDKLEDQPPELLLLEYYLQLARDSQACKALAGRLSKLQREVKALHDAWAEDDGASRLVAAIEQTFAIMAKLPLEVLLLLSPPLADFLLAQSRDGSPTVASLLLEARRQRAALQELSLKVAAAARAWLSLKALYTAACLGKVFSAAALVHMRGLELHNVAGIGIDADAFTTGEHDPALPDELLPEMQHLYAKLLGSPAPADASRAAARQRLEKLVEGVQAGAAGTEGVQALWTVFTSTGGSGALADCRILLYGDILTKLHGPGGHLQCLGLSALKLAAPAKHIDGEAWGLPSPLHAAMSGANEALALAHGQLSDVAARLARRFNTAAFTAEQRAAFVAPTYDALVARMRELENLAAAQGLEGRLASAQHQVEAGKGGGMDGGVFVPAGSQAPASTRELELELELAEERRRRQAVEALVAEERRHRQAAEDGRQEAEAQVAKERCRRQAAEERCRRQAAEERCRRQAADIAQLRGQLDKAEAQLADAEARSTQLAAEQQRAREASAAPATAAGTGCRSNAGGRAAAASTEPLARLVALLPEARGVAEAIGNNKLAKTSAALFQRHGIGISDRGLRALVFALAHEATPSEPGGRKLAPNQWQHGAARAVTVTPLPATSEGEAAGAPTAEEGTADAASAAVGSLRFWGLSGPQQGSGVNVVRVFADTRSLQQVHASTAAAQQWSALLKALEKAAPTGAPAEARAEALRQLAVVTIE